MGRLERGCPFGLFALSQFGMSRLQRALCLESKTVLNVLIACSSSTSDQAENASFASSIEHVHNFTVILPHRMQGIWPRLHERVFVVGALEPSSRPVARYSPERGGLPSRGRPFGSRSRAGPALLGQRRPQDLPQAGTVEMEAEPPAVGQLDIVLDVLRPED